MKKQYSDIGKQKVQDTNFGQKKNKETEPFDDPILLPDVSRPQQKEGGPKQSLLFSWSSETRFRGLEAQRS